MRQRPAPRPVARTATASLPRPLAALLLLTLLLALVPARSALAADAGAEAQFVSLVNQERAARGLPSLQVASDLVAVARRHSVRMADGSNLHHNPNLAGEVSGWQKVGENVGRGPSVSPIHAAFMDSPGHRANILDPEWVEVGIGVEVRDGTVWVTQVFREPQAAAPAPAPAPEPAPTPAAAPAPAAPAPAPAATTAAADAPIRPAAAPTPAAAPAPVAPPTPSPALTICARGGDIPPVWLACPA